MLVDDLRTDAGLQSFCRRWQVRELSLFGSAARDEHTEASDFDFLVTFESHAQHSLLDHARMERELGGLLRRPVDLVTRSSVEQAENPVRREAILASLRTIYDAA